MESTNFLQVVGPMMPLEDDVRKLAYFKWENAGRPDGRDLEFYYAAYRVLSFVGNTNFAEFCKRLDKLRAA